MSILETPRILFRGNVAWDPITTNNYTQLYAEDDATLVPATTTAQQVAAYREAAIAAIDPSLPPTVARGSWNPHGTHRSSFFDTEVTGADMGKGVDTGDPCVGMPIAFKGMLVDCEPYGSMSSQLFFDAMQFGIPGACRVTAPRTSRMMARYINFSRNSYNGMIAGVASVVWQTSFAKTDGLSFDPHGSPALTALAQAVEDDDVLGLTVRWNSYRTIYYDDPTLRNRSPAYAAAAKAQMARIRAGGGFQPNPARSIVVGALGLWRRGEPMHEPGDRALLSVPPGEIVATAHARLQDRRLTIDLANSVTEIDELLTKQNLGTLNVVAVEPDGGVAAMLGTLAYHQYDRVAYEIGAGIVSLDLDEATAAIAAANDIEIRAGDGTAYLTEQALRALPTEQNLYFDEHDDARTTPIQVYARGMPAGAGVDVRLYHALTDGNGVPITLAASATTDGDGVAMLPIAPVAGGSVEGFALTAGADAAAPDQIDTQLTPYMTVRTLPADDAAATLPATWDNVYGKVLATWNALAPCMDNWLRLDDPAQVHAYGAMLKTLTDPANFESFRFMPVTRDMTAGERALLWKFLDGPAPARAIAAVAVAVAGHAPPTGRDTGALSRKMRAN